MAEENKKYLLKEALDELSNEASKKFIESLDISINLGIDSSKSDQNVRGASNLPHGNGKSFRVAVFAEGEEAPPVPDTQIGQTSSRCPLSLRSQKYNKQHQQCTLPFL